MSAERMTITRALEVARGWLADLEEGVAEAVGHLDEGVAEAVAALVAAAWPATPKTNGMSAEAAITLAREVHELHLISGDGRVAASVVLELAERTAIAEARAVELEVESSHHKVDAISVRRALEERDQELAELEAILERHRTALDKAQEENLAHLRARGALEAVLHEREALLERYRRHDSPAFSHLRSLLVEIGAEDLDEARSIVRGLHMEDRILRALLARAIAQVAAHSCRHRTLEIAAASAHCCSAAELVEDAALLDPLLEDPELALERYLALVALEAAVVPWARLTRELEGSQHVPPAIESAIDRLAAHHLRSSTR